MATHFARGILNTREPLSTRLSAACHQSARNLPEYRQSRYRASRGVHPLHAADRYVFNSNENLWINIQHDPDEARAQLVALRRSVLKLTGEAPVRVQLLPGSGRLRTAGTQSIEAICDAETLLVWSIAVTPNIGPLKVWEFDSKEGWRCLPDAQTRAKETDARLMRFTSLPVEKVFSLN